MGGVVEPLFVAGYGDSSMTVVHLIAEDIETLK
jgi:hypothetical protein